MYDEKNTYFCGAKYNNDGYRIVFTRWVYDFDWGGSPEYCWKIVYLYYTVGENNDFRRIDDNYDNKSHYSKPGGSDLYYPNGYIEIETEQRNICFKCSYKGTLWDFIDKEKENFIKAKRNLILVEKKDLETEKIVQKQKKNQKMK